MVRFAVLFTVLSLANSSCAQFTSITVFGDSLSDVGNIDNVTFGIQPGSRYFGGRFSNGPLYSDVLAEKLELGPLLASTEGGSNYAFGIARTQDSPFLEGLFVDDLDEQVDEFLSANQPTDDGLYVVLIGGNDFIVGDAMNPQSIANNTLRQIDRLIQAGARNLLSINLPLLGNVPRGLNNSTSLNERSIAFNETLENGLRSRDSDALNIVRLDLEEIVSVIMEYPGEYGFSNVTNQGINASDASGYLFWDNIHPTGKAHALIAEAAFRQLQAIPAYGGDFDFDGQLDETDVDLLSLQVIQDTNRLSFDLDQDGGVTRSDVDELLSISRTLNGDADFSGDVDFADFLVMSSNFGQSDDQLRWSNGDFDSSGEVGFRDFLIVSRNFGQSSPARSVPEPSGVILACCGWMALVLRKRRP